MIARLSSALILLTIASACGEVNSSAPDAATDANLPDGDDTPQPDAAPASVGELTTPLLPLLTPPVPEQATGETSMGLVIADAQLAATVNADRGGAVIAFMNPGGIRAGLDVGLVTIEDVMRVHPYGNRTITMTLTGAEIEQILEQQWQGPQVRILQPSAGFSYTWKLSASTDRIDPATITLDGVRIDPVRSYRVTANDFLATGGDGFSMFSVGTDRVNGIVDAEALAAYLDAHRPLSAPTVQRIFTAP